MPGFSGGRPGLLRDDEYEDYEEYQTEEEDEPNIDDGLLDSVFDQLPGTGRTRPPAPQPRPAPAAPRTSPTRAGGGFYYCIMGGNNARGPVSAVTVMDLGTYRVPTTPLIAPFPSFMTRGSGKTFSVFSGSNLHTCTPGYYSYTHTLLPASTFGPLLGQQSFTPGSCNGYDWQRRQWVAAGGGQANQREGGNTLGVGSYILSLGGMQAGQPATAVEIFDPRRPRTGWRAVPQWSFPRATTDTCSVVHRDPLTGPQVMVTGGRGEERSAMKLVLGEGTWYSVPPMHHPRTQHGCTSVTLNGRPGLVVSGGVDTASRNTSSVEFFDLHTHSWIDLPGLSRGRRGHTMTTIDGQLAVVGGAAATGFRGEQEEYLDDVEIFDGRQWKSAGYRLDQPRVGANLVRIPTSNFNLG